MKYTKEEIKLKIEELEKQQKECISDFAFWSIQKSLDYWKQKLYQMGL